MANNNVQNVKFLRNGVVFVPSNDKTAREVALDAMEKQKANLADGTAILGRYKETDGVVKTLVGFAYISDDAKTNTLTVFDVDGAGADVDKKIKTAIEALDAEIPSSDGKNVQVKVTEVDGKIKAVNITTDNTVNSNDLANAIETEISKLDYSDTAVDVQYVSQVSETDGKIAVTRVALPTVDAISAAGKPITAVSENLGAISATAGTINADFVDIADNGGKFTATTVEDALAEIAAEIDAMDLPVVSGDGEVITAVSEENGKVSASKTAIKDVKLTGYVKNTTATGAISGNDDIEDALSKLENTIGSNAISNADGSITVTPPVDGSTTDVKVHIKSGERVIKLDGERGGIYTNLNLVEITDETALPAETKVRYELHDSDGVKIGESIDIPKDSHIVSITYDESTQKLVYTYIDVEGKNKTTEIDLSHLILETEFASGVTFSNGVAHGVVDQTSENFLTVGDNGFKLAGVQDAINTAISGLDATVGSTSVENDKHVAVQVVEDAGKLTALTVTENDIASKSLLDGLSGKTVTEVASSNGSIKATLSDAADKTKHLDIITDASKIKMSGFTSTDALSDITESSSVKDALLEVDKVITEKAEVISTALNDLEATKAEKTALAAEIATRKAIDGVYGDVYTADTNATYIRGAYSLYGADQALDRALKAAYDAMLTGVVAGNGIMVFGNPNHTQTICVKVKNDNGILIDDTGLHLGTIDCGTY